MKRVLSLFLSCLLMLTALGSCAEKTLLDPNDPVTLTMWHVYGEQADAPMNLLIHEFNETVGREKGINITVTNVSSSSKINGQLYDSFDKKPGALEMPDLFSCHTTTAMTLGAENLVDFNRYFSRKELFKYVPAFLEDGIMDEKLVVFPVSKSTYALYVNGSQFERFSNETGVDYDSLSTWKGLFEAAEEYYKWSGGRTFMAMDYFVRHLELDVMAKGGEVNYTENGWYDCGDPGIAASLKFFAEPMAKGYISVSDTYANTQIMTGDVCAGIGSTAAIIYFNDTVTYPDNTTEPTNLKVLPLPKSGTGKEYIPQTGVGMAAYYTTDKKAEAAAVFLAWFTEGSRNLEFVAETGYMPVHSAALAEIDSFDFENEGYVSLYEAIGTMLDKYEPVVRPDITGFYGKTDALYDGLRQLLPQLKKRAAGGEAVDGLIGEIEDLFASIG